MNELLSDYQRVKHRLQELSKTEEYQRKCQFFLSEMNRLTEFARSILPQIPQLRTKHEAETVRREYASGCKYLHRGFYAPSPVIDQLVHGLKRGKLLKRITSRSSPSFEYGFDAAGRLLWSSQLIDHQLAATEYLIYWENSIYGITLDRDGHLQNVTEEVWENGTILRYTKVPFIPFLAPFYCYEILCEEYCYENESLQLNWHHLNLPPQSASPVEIAPDIALPSHPIYRCDSYLFEKRDGQFILV